MDLVQLHNNSLAANVSSVLSCTPQTFDAVFFKAGEYEEMSNQAHTVLGASVIAMVGTWVMFALEYISLLRSYLMAGSIQAGMGVYLLLWTQVLLSPDHVASGELYYYSMHDVKQLQHLGIALLLLACGFNEIFWSQGITTHRHWHVLWAISMSFVGLLFMNHPQMHVGAAVAHIMLGLFLSMGAQLFLISKRLGFPESIYTDPYMGVAGVFFMAGGIILLSFREASETIHRGLSTHCQSAWPITLLANLFAGFMLASQIFVLVMYKCYPAKWQQWTLPSDPSCDEVAASHENNSSGRSSNQNSHRIEREQRGRGGVDCAPLTSSRGLNSSDYAFDDSRHDLL